MRKVGVIGSTGKMGSRIIDALKNHSYLQYGLGYSRSCSSLWEIFSDSDYVIDVSHRKITREVLDACKHWPKPLIICTTGWNGDNECNKLIDEIAARVPVVISPNNCIEVHEIKIFTNKLAAVLGGEYDIDISDIHQRDKVDAPSGTSRAIAESIQKTLMKHKKVHYDIVTPIAGPRPSNSICVSWERRGSLCINEVKFTSDHSAITIKHEVFDRKIFALGGVKILEWLHKNDPAPAVYSDPEHWICDTFV